MISFSPALILIPYGIYFAVHIGLCLVNLKHIFKTGSASMFSFTITAAFLLYTLIVLAVTWGLVESFPWTEPVNLSFGALFGDAGSFGSQ